MQCLPFSVLIFNRILNELKFFWNFAHILLLSAFFGALRVKNLKISFFPQSPVVPGRGDIHHLELCPWPHNLPGWPPTDSGTRAGRRSDWCLGQTCLNVAYVPNLSCQLNKKHLILEMLFYTSIAEFANTEDPDETAHNEPSHLDLQCLPFSLLIFNRILYEQKFFWNFSDILLSSAFFGTLRVKIL